MRKNASLMVAVVVFALLTARCGAAEGERFLTVRTRLIHLYGAAPGSDILDYLERSRERYRDTDQTYFLYQCAAFAELAGLGDVQEKYLLAVLHSGDEGVEFLLYITEFLRANGRLDLHVGDLLRETRLLEGDDRIKAVRTLAFAYAWREPPEGLFELVEGLLDEGLPLSDFVALARSLAGWGRWDRAVSALCASSYATGTDSAARLSIVSALSAIGAAQAAHDVAAGAFAGASSAEPTRAVGLGDLYLSRQSLVSRKGDLAAAGSAWDVLLEAAGAGEDARLRVLDRAAVYEAAEMKDEEAETIEGLGDNAAAWEARALRAGVLVKAGDVWTTRKLLGGTLGAGVPGSEDAWFDLMDSLIALRDTKTLEAFASLFALAFPQPQQARSMSDWLRGMGNYAAADRLFGVFVDKTGMGIDTRFVWQGKRLWSIYYLDTGRLTEGVRAAQESLALLVEQPHLHENRHSPIPTQFADLFERFGRLDYLEEYCRKRQTDFENSILLRRIRMEVLEREGRWDEAVMLDEETNRDRDEVSRLLFAASANARAGRWEEVARLYAKALEADPSVPAAAWQGLAEAYGHLDAWHKAEAAFTDRPGSSGAAAISALGAFYAERGQLARASRAYLRLDDLTLDVDAGHMASAVRFWVSSGEINTAAEVLARRISLQTSFASKFSYIEEAAPHGHAAASAYIDFGAALEETPLGGDRILMGAFYRTVGAMLERTLDPRRALDAYGRARLVEVHNPTNAMVYAAAAADWRPKEALEAAEICLSKLPLEPVLCERARARLALGRPESAQEGFSDLMSKPIRFATMERMLDSLETYGSFEEDLGRPSGLWPWVFRARLAAAKRGDGEAEIRTIAAEGGYIGRALWAVEAVRRAENPERAMTCAEDYRKSHGFHPAMSLSAGSLALALGRTSDAGRHFDEGRGGSLVEPVCQLFQDEIDLLEATGQ